MKSAGRVMYSLMYSVWIFGQLCNYCLPDMLCPQTFAVFGHANCQRDKASVYLVSTKPRLDGKASQNYFREKE